MSGAKETPRQKMIGMMYLFYTALLALNIAADVLNAFVLVNEGMKRTNTNFGSKNELLMTAFARQLENDKAKVGPYYEKALKAEKYAEELVAYLNDVQNRLIIGTEFDDKTTENFEFILKSVSGEDSTVVYKEAKDIPTHLLTKKDKYNVPMEILISEVPGKTREADVMKEKFKEFNTKMMGLLDPKDRADIKLGLTTEDVYNPVDRKWQTWEHNNFHHTVLVADLVLMNKFISEVLNTESEILAKLFSYIDAKSLKFDAVKAALVPTKGTVIISGADYEADIFVAAYSKTDNPLVDIKRGVDKIDSTEGSASRTSGAYEHINEAVDGVVKYKVRTGATGEFKYAGFIHVKGPDGKYQQKQFNGSYTVIQPMASVSADKMNAVYRKLDNPITVTAAGFTNDKIRVSVTGGNLKSMGNGKYIYQPGGNDKKVTFSVTGTKSDGTAVQLGKMEFRVMGVPAPIIRLAGQSDGEISKDVISSQPFLTASMDNFVFDLKYTVSRYEIQVFSADGKMVVRENVTGSKLSANSVTKIKAAPRGSIINILSVRTTGPDGEKPALGITLKIK